ncbi:MAG: hypothetical protein ACI80V_002004 [Rhodothermales bacterium]|jgi:uncharacterized protein (DUF1697 family)
MTSWIALFRGINVGGNNILKMAELRSDLESLNLKNVRSYIQSGNVIFDSAAGTASSLAERIGALVHKQHGFQPSIFILKRDDLLSAVASNPFPGAVSEPKTLHFFFLQESAANPDFSAIEKAKAETESYRLMDRVFYLHAPDGIGRSKLAANAEKYLGVAGTGRNYRTVDKLLSLAA